MLQLSNPRLGDLQPSCSWSPHSKHFTWPQRKQSGWSGAPRHSVVETRNTPCKVPAGNPRWHSAMQWDRLGSVYDATTEQPRKWFLQVIKQKKKATLQFSSSTVPAVDYVLPAQCSWRCFIHSRSSLTNYEMEEVQWFNLPLHSSKFTVGLRKGDSAWQVLNSHDYVRFLNFIFTSVQLPHPPT